MKKIDKHMELNTRQITRQITKQIQGKLSNMELKGSKYKANKQIHGKYKQIQGK